MRSPLKVGIVGVGSMGKNHLRVLSMLKDVELSFIYDSDTSMLHELGRHYGVRPSADLDSDLSLVDAVVLVTPTSTHYDYIKRIGGAGCAILVEKPLTDSLDTSEEIRAFAEEQGVRLQVGFIERFNPAVMALKKVISHAGRVINMDFTRTNKVSSRISDVDVVLDLMIHDIDLALYLNGPARGVTAYGVAEEGMVAFARATIRHESGAFSSLTASRITERRHRQISATCAEMYVDCNLLRKEVLVNRQTLEQYLENVSISSKEETIDVRPEEALLSELVSFVRFAATGDSSAVPTASDGCEAMRIAAEVQRIIREER